jgi:RNA 2',3'-cyclic 3'-phosphodiesterase
LTTERARRLFLALWPDDATRARIDAATAAHLRSAGGKPMGSGRLHVTVAFLGSVAEGRIAGLAAALAPAAASVPAFDVTLRRVDWWRRQRLLVLEPDETPRALLDLVDAALTVLADCGFARETRPFRTHLTLAREARAPLGVVRDIEPVEWRVRALTLVESVTLPSGACYEPLQSWPLAHEKLADANAFARCEHPHSVT